MSYHRPLSPGGRRITNPGRVSDGLPDPYHARHNSFTSPRASTGVIPISTETFINIPPPQTTRERPTERYDSYSGRPRKSSLVDQQRSTTASSGNQVPPAPRRPTVVQDTGRTRSPQKNNRGNNEYYITPASSKEPRKVEHKKLYSVDDGSAKLVARVDVPAGGDRHHKRRESGDVRGGHRDSTYDRGRRGYLVNGEKKVRDKSIDDEGAYSYTDAAGMYRDTEPRWRDVHVRPRRGSMDRGGAMSRERPVSMLNDPAVSYDPRTANKEIGPPPSTRGWDKINDGLGRARSVRDTPARVAQSPTRGRYPEAGAHSDPRDPYYVPPRASSNERRNLAVHQDRPIERYDDYGYDERREPRRHERRNSVTRSSDRSIERRGFGIRNDSKDRYGRSSDENFERQQTQYRESGYAEPHRRDTAPEIPYHEEKRLEQEKRDHMAVQQLQNEERERQWEWEAREKEQRRREEDRGYDRDYERDRERPRERDREYEHDRERERERERNIEREPERDRERERHHHRRETADRDGDYRKEPGPRDSGNSLVQPGLAGVATGGLAGAAAALGLNKLLNKDKDKDPDREQGREREREPERVRNRERERDREQERRSEEPRSEDRERIARVPGSFSDDAPLERERERNYRDPDRGLGFAFENSSEPPTSAPPRIDRERERERMEERDFERQHEDKAVEMPNSVTDVEEDYRRRMEQVQRELGQAGGQNGEFDTDRERRRRERELRQRERDDRERNGDVAINAGIGLINEQPPPPPLRRSFENESEASSQQTSATLRRKPSILDQAMGNESAQIIDNSMSERRENRVRIVDPPTEDEDRRPKGILKKPTQKFPEHPNAVREGVAPLKDATKNGIPPGARWTKIDRRLVNPEALDEAKERFEERLDCVIVLRVLTKEEIQKLADRTRELRDERYEEERGERKAARRRERNRDRQDRDEYSDDSEDEYGERGPKMLEAPSSAGPSSEADFVRDNRERRSERERERETQYASGGSGRRE